MYKVFVNEKKLSLSKHPDSTEKQLLYEGLSTIEMAVDLLESTSCPEINVYAHQLDALWRDFSGIYRNIEAAGGVVVNDSGEILFIRRFEKWDLPKGKAEKGETPEDTAVREIEEETGLKGAVIRQFLNTTYHIYTERNGEKILKIVHWFIMDYHGKQSPIPQIEEGILEVSWKNEDEIRGQVLGKTFRNIELMLNEYCEISKQ
ncbi:MAG: NUDIX domain-containing protein [Bergeyella sp.]